MNNTIHPQHKCKIKNNVEQVGSSEKTRNTLINFVHAAVLFAIVQNVQKLRVDVGLIMKPLLATKSACKTAQTRKKNRKTKKKKKKKKQNKMKKSKKNQISSLSLHHCHHCLLTSTQPSLLK